MHQIFLKNMKILSLGSWIFLKAEMCKVYLNKS